MAYSEATLEQAATMIMNHRRQYAVGQGCFHASLVSASHSDARGILAGAGSLRVSRDAVRRLRLAAHPMVVKVRQLIGEGYQVRVSLGPNARKGYGKIRVWRDDDRRTVQIDGSVKDGWD